MIGNTPGGVFDNLKPDASDLDCRTENTLSARFLHQRPTDTPMRYTSSYLTLLQSLATKMLSHALPLPSQLMRTSAALSRFVNSVLVNCDPWSLLKISGRALSNACSSASRQNAVSNVIEVRQASTYRLNQSM